MATKQVGVTGDGGKPRMVKVAGLKIDHKFYPRHKIDRTYIAILRKCWEDGAVFPPIVVWEGPNIVVDGFNRHQSNIAAFGDESEIQAVFKRFPTEAEALLFAISSNATHGKRLSPIDWKHSALLGKDLGLSPAKVAAALGIQPQRLIEILTDECATTKEKGDEEPKVIPLKPLNRGRWAGKPLPPRVEAGNKKICGWSSPKAFINQMIAAFDCQAFDSKDEGTVALMTDLHERIEKWLGV